MMSGNDTNFSNETEQTNSTTSNNDQTTHCIKFQDVINASKRIQNIVHKTPVMTSQSFHTLCNGQNIFFKVEALQRTGSFKFRGALNATLRLMEEQQQQQKEDSSSSSNDIHVVTHSSGNHAAALALAAKLASQQQQIESETKTANKNVKATIVMPKNAPTIKVNGVKGFGGNIVMVDNTNEAREEKADEIVDECGAVFIHPSENEYVIAGQGTAGLEFVSQVREINMEKESGSNSAGGTGDDVENCNLDAVIIPVGGGGLAAGNAIAIRGKLGQNVKIILAEPEIMDDAKRSYQSKTLLGHDPSNPLASVADGLKTTLGPNTWPIVRDLVDDIITVSEDDILRATKLIWERLKIMIEPSAGVGVAVAMGEEFQKKFGLTNGIGNVGVILCGGNVDILKIGKLMEERGI